MKREKILKKLRKTYIKMLYAFSNGLISRGYELEDKAIRLELKLKEKEHEHAEAMRAFAAGEKLEFRPKKDASLYGSTDEWYPCDNPDFHHNFEYRIKRDD